jgi:hypothetical protein
LNLAEIRQTVVIEAELRKLKCDLAQMETGPWTLLAIPKIWPEQTGSVLQHFRTQKEAHRISIF